MLTAFNNDLTSASKLNKNKLSVSLVDISSIFRCNPSIPTQTPTPLPTRAPNPLPSTEAPLPDSYHSVTCPEIGKTPKEFTTSSSVRIDKVSANEICLLHLIEDNDGQEVLIPLGRSYENNPWETVPGPYRIKFNCNGSTCETNDLPQNEENLFRLTSFGIDPGTLDSQNIAARFIEQTTFGPTQNDLELWNDVQMVSTSELDRSFAEWITNQIHTVPITSHREYFRKNISKRGKKASLLGPPLHPCDPLTRWHSQAFTLADSYYFEDFETELPYPVQIEKTSDNSAYLLSINGVPRTEVQDLQLVNKDGEDAGTLAVPGTYALCTRPELQDFIGGVLGFETEEGCLFLATGNPRISFMSSDPTLPPNTITLSSDDFGQFSKVPGSYSDDEYLLFDGLNEDICTSLKNGSYPVVLNFSNDVYLAFDPRLTLLENTLENPTPDGGKQHLDLEAGCANVPRTFLNEDSCKVSEMNVCIDSFKVPDIDIRLTPETVRTFYDLTNRYVYAIEGLRPIASPCVLGTKSRWKRIGDASTCPTDNGLSEGTTETLQKLISEGDFENDLRQIRYSDDKKECNTLDYEPEDDIQIHIVVESSCWQLVHPNHHDVIDMTSWVTRHPGGADKITSFAENGSIFLNFPSHHEMLRWENNVGTFEIVGAYNQTVRFREIPFVLQTSEMAEELKGDYVDPLQVYVVCGSPYEVSNNHAAGEVPFTEIVGFGMDEMSKGDMTNQKQVVWTNIVLSSQDQLRQRMAWAISQIFAIDAEGLNEEPKSESFIAYYDIFVRHAFGNYFDILKEVSYSPLMAEYLTFLDSRSSADVLRKKEVHSFADENYAREVMQLFTIGTVLLNMDGTPKLDSNTGEKILTYNNEHIMSFARAWTGFYNQQVRGNIAIGERPNRIDPMMIMAERRDVFPKIDLLGGYIGDGYPLCHDLPERAFLRKGATYRFLGSSTSLELSGNPDERVEFDPLVNVFTLDTASGLYQKLCNPSSNGGECEFDTKTTLDDNIACYGQECLVDTVRLLQVTDGMFFEYVRQPCVQMSYYNNPKAIGYREFPRFEMCGDPRYDVAGESCCESDKTGWQEIDKNCQYAMERVRYDTASQRCAAIGKTLCFYEKIRPPEEDSELYGECSRFLDYYHWYDVTCLLKVKIQDGTGKVAIVHKPYIRDDPEKVPLEVHSNSVYYFPVYWTSDYPNLSNNCGDGTCEIMTEGCLCNTTVVDTTLFSSAPNTIDDISKLHIGSVSPDTFDEGYYDAPITEGEIKIHFRSGMSYDMDTIFEIDIEGETKYYKNMKSMVEIVSLTGDATSQSFRNPPHFMNLMSGSDLDARDAHYETNEVLNHYFKHPNVAPFLAIHVIQRFGISNPSTNYIEAVATAFKNGIYSYGDSSGPDITYGNGKYGDLEATIAAVILYREARSVVLDFDPTKGSLKEPLLKVIGFMRSMEYESFDGLYQSQRFSTRLLSMPLKIGQMVFRPTSIFSFFRRDYQPNGPIQQASLVAPEAQRYITPSVIGLINGLFQMIKFGLSGCIAGFGANNIYSLGQCREDGDFTDGWGNFSLTTTDPSNPEIVVDELATLLTAGRLNEETRGIIKTELEGIEDEAAAVRYAQQLIAVTPEFHSTNLFEFNGEKREIPDQPIATKPYKAVVYLMLSGGMDSFNVIVPHSGCTRNMYDEYATERGDIALAKSSLKKISRGNQAQVCDFFGVHPDLPVLKSLYNDGDLTFFANVGVLFEDVTLSDWSAKTTTQLFAHNVQQQDTQQVDPFQEVPGTGFVGRMADVLTSNGYSAASFSVSGESHTLIGEPNKSPSINYVSTGNMFGFNPKPTNEGMNQTLLGLNELGASSSGFFSQTWSNQFTEYVAQTKRLFEELESATTSVEFKDTKAGNGFRAVSNIIKTRNELGHDRQMFYLDIGGWDSHLNQFEFLEYLIPELNEGIDAFTEEMKELGLWDDVVLVCASDFGRTLTPNSGSGTDHGWGGNYFMLGGSLNGGNIFGTYPDDLTPKSSLNVGRGRFIPTTSWDAILNPVAEWFGITEEEDLNKVLPNRNKFDLYDKSEMFE